MPSAIGIGDDAARRRRRRGVRRRTPARRVGRGDAARTATGTVTSMRSSPMRAFSSSGVPWATVRPWSSTTMSSASRSASSRYCVVRMTVVPSRTRSRSMSHRSPRLRGSRPVVGSSRNSTSGAATRLAARSSRRRMPPENVFTSAVAASVEVEPLEQLVGRGARPRASGGGAGGRPSRG